MRKASLAAALVLAAMPVQAAPIVPFDAHVDIPETFDPARADRPGQGQFDLSLAAAGGLKGAALAIFAPQEGPGPEGVDKAQMLAERKYAIVTAIARDFPARAAIAHDPAEFRRITASGRFAIVESIVNGGAFITSVADLDHWLDRGVQMFGFVHAGHNGLADSSRPSGARHEGVALHGGLSPLGQQVLARLNDRGVLVDVSQLSDAAFDQVLRLTRAPVIASHSDVRALVKATRNLTDAQLDAIKANGGVVGLVAFSAYLHGPDAATTAKLDALRHADGLDQPDPAPDKVADFAKRSHEITAAQAPATVGDLADAVTYVVRRIGIDHVALSTDFNHGGGITGWKDESETQGITAELRKRGFSDADLAKIWSGNVLRIWAAAKAAARTR